MSERQTVERISLLGSNNRKYWSYSSYFIFFFLAVLQQKLKEPFLRSDNTKMFGHGLIRDKVKFMEIRNNITFGAIIISMFEGVTVSQ